MNDASNALAQRMCSYPSRIGTGEMIGNKKEDARKAEHPGLVLGVIWGEARGISIRNNSQNPEEGPALGLVGAFEFTPADLERPLLRSGVCFLPRTIHDMVVAVVAEGMQLPKDNPKRGARVNQIGVACPFAFEISAIKSEASVGYKFEVRELVKVATNDPMAAVRAQLGSFSELVTVAGVTAPRQLPAPVKGKGKGGKRGK